jgi:hypothetical protein
MFRERKVTAGAVTRPSNNALRTQCRALFLAGSLILLVGLLGGCGRSNSAAQETQDDYQVTFATEPAQPLVGAGSVLVTVEDKSGQPIAGASVSIEANMNHAGMIPVSGVATESESGLYRVPLKWTMGGAWYVDVRITTSDGQIIRRRFPVDVK